MGLVNRTKIYNLGFFSLFVCILCNVNTRISAQTFFEDLAPRSIATRLIDIQKKHSTLAEKFESIRYTTNFEQALETCQEISKTVTDSINAKKATYSSYTNLFINNAQQMPLTQFVSSKNSRIVAMVKQLLNDEKTLSIKLTNNNFDDIKRTLNPIIYLIKQQSQPQQTNSIQDLISIVSRSQSILSRLIIVIILLAIDYQEAAFLAFSTELLLWYVDEVKSDCYWLRFLCLAGFNMLINTIATLPNPFDANDQAAWRTKRSAVIQGCNNYLYENPCYQELLSPTRSMKIIISQQCDQSLNSSSLRIYPSNKQPSERYNSNIGHLIHCELLQYIDILDLAMANQATECMYAHKIQQELIAQHRKNKRLPPLRFPSSNALGSRSQDQ